MEVTLIRSGPKGSSRNDNFSGCPQSPVFMENNRKGLSLKYRPQSFDEVIGQDVMVQIIKNAIKMDRIPNAYLLTGIRGVGKTTTARIIAKAINCKNSESPEKSAKASVIVKL